MNNHLTHVSDKIIKPVRSTFAKLVLVSITALFGSSAYAAVECPKDINNLIPNYTSRWNYFVADDWKDMNSEWKLNGNGLQPFQITGSDFRLEKMRVKTLATADNWSTEIGELLCDYKDHSTNRNERLVLSLQSRGKLTIGNGYTVRTGNIDDVDRPELWEPVWAPVITEYTCSDAERCGSLNFDYIKPQLNVFWANAWPYCHGWVRCEGTFGYRNYVAEIQAIETYKRLVPNSCGDAWALMGDKRGNDCVRVDSSKTHCADRKCTQEIAAMNNIIGPNATDGIDHHLSGMAKYLKMSWANKKWQGKHELNSFGEPIGTWPDYSELEP